MPVWPIPSLPPLLLLLLLRMLLRQSHCRHSRERALDRLSTPFAVDLPCSVSYPNHVYCGTAYHVRTGARRSCRLQIENTSVQVEAVDSHNSIQ